MIASDEKLLILIEACNRDDEESWEIFYKEYGKIVWNYLNRHGSPGGRKEAIEDITQRVFIKLYKGGLADFRGATRYEFLSYLRQIATNEEKTYFRLKKREQREIPIEQKAEGEEIGDIIPNVSSGDPNPEEETLLKERKQIIEQVVKGLPIEDQQIVIMIAIKGYKYKEAGQSLNIPDGTVASRYSRIKEKLEKGLNALFKKDP